jgi:aldose 1-epimerase
MLHTLENEYWQVGILPETGASVAFGRVQQNGQWRDVLRPTDPADYDNPSKCASFVLIPWSNRIRDARFTFAGHTYQLEVNSADGTAIHGDTRRRIWQVESAGKERISLSFNSTAHASINFPWHFAANAVYELDGRDFMMVLSLKNIDEEPFPGGFGQHPYFVRTDEVMLRLPAAQMYAMDSAMPSGPALPVPAAYDFRTARRISEAPPLNDLYRCQLHEQDARVIYPDWGVEIAIHSDPVYEHVIVFSPEGQPFFAVEPVTNANDGFNLFAQGVPGTGVFVLQPGEEQRGIIHLRLV